MGNTVGVLVVVVRADSWRYTCPAVAFRPWREAQRHLLAGLREAGPGGMER